MATASYPTIPASGQVSTAFAVALGNQSLYVQLPTSLTASEVRIQYAQSSAGPFGDLMRRDGSGLVHVIASLATGSASPMAILPVGGTHGRIFCVAAQGAVRSFTVLPAYVPA